MKPTNASLTTSQPATAPTKARRGQTAVVSTLVQTSAARMATAGCAGNRCRGRWPGAIVQKTSDVVSQQVARSQSRCLAGSSERTNEGRSATTATSVQGRQPARKPTGNVSSSPQG